MRTIKFRIKRLVTESGDPLEKADESNDFNWYYLSLVNDVFIGEAWHPIDYYDISTLGEYIGMKDASGRDIYEGDIVETLDSEHVGEVIFDQGSFEDTTGCIINQSSGLPYRIIGNKYDSPGRLQEKQDEWNRKHR